MNATPDAYFAIQDADDWSEPERLALLMDALQAEEAHFASSASYSHAIEKNPPVVTRHDGFLERHKALTDHFRHRMMHQGLYRTAALRAIGGYYAGFRIAYDTLLTNLMLMTGPVASVDIPLYHRRVRPESLTTARSTGFRSPARVEAVHQIRELYHAVFAEYAAHRAGKRSATQLIETIRSLSQKHVTPQEHEALNDAGDQVKSALSSRYLR